MVTVDQCRLSISMNVIAAGAPDARTANAPPEAEEHPSSVRHSNVAALGGRILEERWRRDCVTWRAYSAELTESGVGVKERKGTGSGIESWESRSESRKRVPVSGLGRQHRSPSHHTYDPSRGVALEGRTLAGVSWGCDSRLPLPLPAVPVAAGPPSPRLR